MRSLMRSKVEEEECKEYMVCSFAFVFMVILVVGIYIASKQVNVSGSEELAFSNAPAARRLLLTSNTTTEDYGDGGNNGDSPNRVGLGPGAPCSKGDILVFQGQTTPLPNGIPTYTVEIENVCLWGRCSISGIHLSCGWFSSARLIDPIIFRRIDYDDCLVNDGKTLNPGEALSFQYANTFAYPLSVSTVTC